MIENRDVSFLAFLSDRDFGIDFVPVNDIVNEFKGYINELDEEGKTWVTNRWVGWALKRLNLIIDKRRTSQGMEVMINAGKVREKAIMLKPKKKEADS